MKKAKKAITTILLLSMVCSLASVKAEASSAMKLNGGRIRKSETNETAETNNTEIVLYAMDDMYKKKLSIPSEMAQEYKINEPDGSFTVIEGKSVTVSDDGLIRPAGRRFGKSIVKVCTEDRSYEVAVTVCNYADIYAEKIMDNYIAKNISDDMSDLDKLKKIAAFPARYNYSVYYQSYTDMIIFGGGDCWASTNAIVHMCRKIGLQARSRYAANDSGAGAGHRNAAVSINGKTYMAEAGYDGTAPRRYSVKQITSIYYKKNEDGETVSISRYDGADYNVTIPAEIKGYKVTAIGNSAFADIDMLESVTIPEGVTKIDKYAFYACFDLKKISLPSTLKTIESEAFFGSGLLSVEIPAGTTEIGERAFFQSVSADKDMYGTLKSVTFMGNQLKTIGDQAFYACGLKTVSIPSSVTSIGKDAFMSNDDLEEINVAPDNPNYASADGVLFDKRLTTLLQYPAAKSDDVYCVPNGVSVIGEYAFEDVKILRKVVLPGDVRSVKSGAFGYSESVDEIWFLGDAPDIDKTAFATTSTSEGYLYHRVYYPADNSTWTKNFMAGLEGNLEWIPDTDYDEDNEDDDTDNDEDYDDTDYDADNDEDDEDYDDTDDESVNNSEIQKVKKPGRVKIISVSAGKRKLTILWNWKSGVSGYQIQCAQNKKFTKKKKSKTVGKYKSRATIKNLKKGKKYYVRVCAYITKNGKKMYGKWSKVKNVKMSFRRA